MLGTRSDTEIVARGSGRHGRRVSRRRPPPSSNRGDQTFDHTPTDLREERLLIRGRAATALDPQHQHDLRGETAEQSTYIAMAYYAGETLSK